MSLRLAVTAACVLVLCAGCGVRGLNFLRDDRLTITSPQDRATLSLPVTVSWEVKDFRITGPDGATHPDAGYFGVYVNRAPQQPGRTQADMVRDDPACRINPECPSAEFLARQDIHSTDQTQFTIERLPDLEGGRFHEVTIVFLNGRGQRIGESAFSVRFEV